MRIFNCDSCGANRDTLDDSIPDGWKVETLKVMSFEGYSSKVTCLNCRLAKLEEKK